MPQGCFQGLPFSTVHDHVDIHSFNVDRSQGNHENALRFKSTQLYTIPLDSFDSMKGLIFSRP